MRIEIGSRLLARLALLVLAPSLLAYSCQDATSADVNADGWVDAHDLARMDACIPDPGAPACARADVEGDGDVDAGDRAVVESFLGEQVFTGVTRKYTPQAVLIDEDGVLYLHAPGHSTLYRWSLPDDHALSPIRLGADSSHVAYSSEHHRIYVEYGDGRITWIDVELPVSETPFVTLPGAGLGLATVQGLVFTVDGGSYNSSHRVFSSGGTQLSSSTGHYETHEYVWSGANERIYFLRDVVSPNDLLWQAIDPATGQLGATDDSPYHGQYPVFGVTRVSDDGTRILLGSGDVYDGSSLEVTASLPIDPIDAAWRASNELLTLHQGSSGGTRLRHWRSDLQTVYDEQNYPGTPLRVLRSGAEFAVVTRVSGRPVVHRYVPDEDVDGDGVANEQDGFPLDLAASQDSDGDGYPDAWNPGKGPEDSTTGLVLDAFPFDATCQLPEHATPGDPTTCDIARSVPEYVPSHIEVDAAGIVYLLSPENDSVFRWSLVTNNHLRPVDLAGGSSDMALSEDRHTLYLGNASGAITKLDLTASEPAELPFATASGNVYALQTFGSYVFADIVFPPNGGNTARHSTFTAAGVPVASADLKYDSVGFTWSPERGRMYYTRERQFPNVLLWDSLDPATGAITGGGQGPHHDEFQAAQPVRMAPDHTQVLVGSGAIYDAITLKIEAALPHPVVDALWTEDGLFTIRPDPAGTRVERWDANLTRVDETLFPGEPLRLLQWDDAITLVTRVAGKPAFQPYTPGFDGDGDGVDTVDDAFPLDPAASQDSDHDGYPDAWNPGQGAEQSTQALVLDAFPLDLACQLPEHGSAGACDTVDVLPTSPEQAFCQSDSVPAQESGFTDFGPSGDFVPLCDGWILLAETHAERVVMLNAITGREGARFALPSAPGDLELDEAHKVLYVALPNQVAFAAVHLLTGETRTIQTQGFVRQLAVGPAGGLFVGAGFPYWEKNLFWLASPTALPGGGWPVTGTLMRWNPVAGELVVGQTGSSPSSLARYAFNSITGPTQLQLRANAGSNGQDLAISPDGQHLGFAAGGGNQVAGPVYSIADFVPTNLASYRGVFATGHYPRSVDFDRDSAHVATTNYSSFEIYDVASFVRLHSFSPELCSSGPNTGKVAFSRGGSLVIGLQGCETWNGEDYVPSTRLDWFVAP